MWPFHFVLLLLASSFVAAGRGFGARSGGRIGGFGGSRGSGHSYPHSNGYSGTGTGGSHLYPRSNGYSGNNHYRQNNVYNQPHGSYSGHKTEIHNHYHYSPPQHISYGGVVSHSVYTAAPPVYVYQYRDSGSRYDSLLAGLALYNLGKMSAGSSHYRYDSSNEYKSKPGEICKLGISKQNGEYEETRIDCKLMSSFILEAESNPNHHQQEESKVTTTVNVSHGANGDTTTTTVVEALQVKGPSIRVTPGMNCFMIRISRDSSVLKRNVQCGLLQAYAVNSLHYSSGKRLVPSLTIVVPFLMFVMNYIRI